MWYQRLFGDTQHFAIAVEMDTDPHSTSRADSFYERSWGRFTIWANGRCLTQSIRAGVVSEAVEWYIEPLIRWIDTHAIALLNEEPFPAPLRTDRVASAADWLQCSEDPPLTLTEAEEGSWFATRSSWRQRHGLRMAFVGAAVPNVYLRRLGDFIEVSWDNERWPPGRADVRFSEQAGVSRVGARRVEDVLVELSRDVRSAVLSRTPAVLDLPIGVPHASPDDWTWLVPASVRRIVAKDPNLRGLVERLRTRTEATLVVPHTLETLLLRDCHTAEPGDLQALLELKCRQGALSERLGHARRLTPAPGHEPWRSGYEMALELREALGWGNEPAPAQLQEWLASEGVDVSIADVSPSINGWMVAQPGRRPAIGVNPGGIRSRRWSPRVMQAAGLGLVLMDTDPDTDYARVFTRTAHWPTIARASAFATMFLMPEDGVREAFSSIGVSMRGVRAVMERFGTTLDATTFHLKNLGLIDEDTSEDFRRSESKRGSPGQEDVATKRPGQRRVRRTKDAASGV
ncbi:MAG: ImmA/IrrE family metallo-endopeptidase [Bradymonadia bacterium]